VQISPDGKYVVDTFSQPDVAPETTLRDAKTGALIMPLEKADISKLLATGWKPPMQIKMTAADGRTDIYGMLFRPTNFDPSKKYPIINNAYPGPQSGSVGSRAFAAARGDKQALAELGFVVVSIDGTGTPNRSKAYTDAYYGAMGRHNTIPDQIAGMKELAKRYPWIDIDKARCGATRAAASSPRTRCCGAVQRILQGRHRRVRATTTSGSTRTTGASATRGRW
jgi:dipeptidyl aminopeptidase/acylaminoacyl peptidase